MDTSTVDFRTALGSALRADGPSYLEQLNRVDQKSLSEKDQGHYALAAQRLASTFIPDPFDLTGCARSIAIAYQSYWRRYFLGLSSEPENEAQLLNELNQVLTSAGYLASSSLDETEDPIKNLCRANSLFALLGVTSPLRDLMLWTSESEQHFSVDLCDHSQDVYITFMEGFLSLGWAGYATGDRHYNGGWATKDRLFAVSAAYDQSSEKFMVSYLAHEAQHFSDFKKFPQLAEQAPLEYRAKLSELSCAKETVHSLLDFFASSVGDDVQVPHAFANRRVIEDISSRLGVGHGSNKSFVDFNATAINAAAFDLLREDTARLVIT